MPYFLFLFFYFLNQIQYGAKSIFISTEDPETITELLAGWNTTYDIYYTKVCMFVLVFSVVFVFFFVWLFHAFVYPSLLLL